MTSDVRKIEVEQSELGAEDRETRVLMLFYRETLIHLAQKAGGSIELTLGQPQDDITLELYSEPIDDGRGAKVKYSVRPRSDHMPPQRTQ